jgi:organic radical activating enzyme
LKVSISEIFTSVEGEGIYFGTKTLFVRLAGCHLKCFWCIGVRPGRRIPRIVFANRANKRINEIKVGDRLLALDERGNLVETGVKEVMKRTVNVYYEIKIENKPLLYFTPEHPICTNKGWIQVKDLKIGDEVFFITHREKMGFFAKHYNTMFNKEVVQKMIRSMNYSALAQKISETRRRKYQRGELVPVMLLMKQANPARYDELRMQAKRRMLTNNPMKKKEIAEKAGRIKSEKYGRIYAELIRRRRPEESPKFREFITKRNPMKNPEVAMKNWISHKKRPTELEKRLIRVIAENSLPVKYVGNGKLWIGSKDEKLLNPDFEILGQSKLIEVYDPTYLDRDEQWATKRVSHFQKYGYESLILPVTRRTNNDVIVKSIRNFVSNGLKVLSIKKFEPTRKYPYMNPKPVTVYNFGCAPYNNYFVEYVLVHNCDTPYALSRKDGKEYEVSEVVKMIDSNLLQNTYKVNFTGGEPLMQHKAVYELAKHVKNKGLRTYLESACFDVERFKEILPLIDICKIEFKLSDSEVVDKEHYSELLENELRCLEQAVKNKKTTYIKVVVSKLSNKKEFEELTKMIFNKIGVGDIEGFIIQPSYGTSEPTMDQLFQFYDVVYPYYEQVRIIPQLHKVMGIP